MPVLRRPAGLRNCILVRRARLLRSGPARRRSPEFAAHQRPAFDLEFRKAEADAISATIAVDDAKPIFLEFEERGVDFHQRLRSEPWGARTFIVRDPDGNLICFAGGCTVERPHRHAIRRVMMVLDVGGSHG